MTQEKEIQQLQEIIEKHEERIQELETLVNTLTETQEIDELTDKILKL